MREVVNSLARAVTVSLLSWTAAALSPGPLAAQLRVPLADRVVSLDGVGYERGNAKASVWMVEFADFGCGFCEKFARETFPVLDSVFVKSGRVYFRFVPFNIGMFHNSREAAEASICAAEQQAFFPMYELLYEHRKEWMASDAPKANMARYAASLRLNAARFARCAASKAVSEQLLRNTALAQSLYIRGTPTFFINGETVPGALPTDVFVKGLEAVIKSASEKR